MRDDEAQAVAVIIAGISTLAEPMAIPVLEYYQVRCNVLYLDLNQTLSSDCSWLILCNNWLERSSPDSLNKTIIQT